MQRQVVCSEVELRTVRGTLTTPDDGSLPAPHEYPYVYVAFDDTIEEPHVQRNSYYLKLPPEEAAGYTVGQVYTLSIG